MTPAGVGVGRPKGLARRMRMNEQPLVVETWPIWYTWPMRAAPVFPIVARRSTPSIAPIYIGVASSTSEAPPGGSVEGAALLRRTQVYLVWSAYRPHREKSCPEIRNDAEKGVAK